MCVSAAKQTRTGPASPGAWVWDSHIFGVTMLLPDNWALYTPVFHLQSLWLAASGAYLLLYGIGQGT